MMNKPFVLAPAAKDYLWGGSRLNDDFNKGIDMSPLAETWECSTHPDGQSQVNGVPLGEILADHPEYLGTHPLQNTSGKPELPILIKIIDAKCDLSVQVHPDDDYALRKEGQLGKTEMWYVLSARKGSRIAYGFNRDMDEQLVREAVKAKRLESLLNYVPIHKDDIFFINTGTVHAIGAGALIVEIQESSNVTYRLYDYDRIDKNGEKRELHLDKALETANLNASGSPRQPMRVLRYRSGSATEHLTRCKYFQVERILLNTEVQRDLVDYKTVSNSFHALLVVDGCGCISGEDYMLNFFKGDCIFVPADSIPLKLHGRAQILDISC